MTTNDKYIIGIFDDEDEVVQAVKEVKSKGVKIEEVYTPFPIHGLDTAIGHPRTRIPVAAFLFGCLGLTLIFSLINYTMVFDWPMIIGGKDFFALPDWIPVSFEGTVLFTAFGMVGTFLVSNSLYPGKQPRIFDIRSTDDKFVMTINTASNKMLDSSIESILKDAGAIEVSVKTF
ncbi:MAG: DUF3341 domain-containing protein [Pseudarcicella sp.]|jgi:hypothetical protein|nr:DUF3341 domain-containing protein [Pseudarcicella sp.]MBP6409788.1 DUF3341 domain-containing protein [Pseudarcicella sp.]